MRAAYNRGGAFAINGIFEALLFTAVVLVDIWFFHWRTRWGDLLPAIFVLLSVIAHRETLESLGLTTRWLAPALLGYAALLAAGCLLAADPVDLVIRGTGYFVWCVLQQLLLQNMIYRRLRTALGPAWRAWLLSGTLFSVAHLPNPILVPATLLWGTVSVRIFERQRNIVVLGTFQTLLSALLLWLTPIELNHQFRVGPGYWRWHPKPAVTIVRPVSPLGDARESRRAYLAVSP